MTSSEFLGSDSSGHLPRSAFEEINVPRIYDELGLDYEHYILEDEGRAKTIQWLISRLSGQVASRNEGLYVVDLGCASGRPTVETIAQSLHDLESQRVPDGQGSNRPSTKHVVMGVDVSPVQLSFARERITSLNPIAQFSEGDMRTWSPPPSRSKGEVDAVVSFYAMNHIPLEDYGPVIQKLATWLRPGGVLCLGFAALVKGRVTWMGYNVVASSMELNDINKLVEGAGCKIEKSWEEDWKSQTREDTKMKRNQFVWAVKQ